MSGLNEFATPRQLRRWMARMTTKGLNHDRQAVSLGVVRRGQCVGPWRILLVRRRFERFSKARRMVGFWFVDRFPSRDGRRPAMVGGSASAKNGVQCGRIAARWRKRAT